MLITGSIKKNIELFMAYSHLKSSIEDMNGDIQFLLLVFKRSESTNSLSFYIKRRGKYNFTNSSFILY